MRIQMLTAFAVLFLSATTLAPPAAAEHCNGTVVDVGGVAYVVVSDLDPEHGYLFSVWVYCESNGQAGLQRGPTTTLFGDYDDCGGSDPNPDNCAIF